MLICYYFVIFICFRDYGYQEQEATQALATQAFNRNFLIHLVSDTVCCAKFSADESWYRAKVVSKGSVVIMRIQGVLILIVPILRLLYGVC